MKRLFHSCGRQRRRLSLLAGGALPESERSAAQAHLAECAECRRHFEQVLAVGRALHSLRERTPEIEVGAAWQRRWRQALQERDRSRRSVVESPLNWWRTAMPGQRATLAGLSAVWMLILFFRLTAPDVPDVRSQTRLPAPREVFMALKSTEVWFKRGEAPPQPMENPPDGTPKPPPPPPRSERGRQHLPA